MSIDDDTRIVSLSFSDTELELTLRNGMQLRHALQALPRIHEADAAAREQWEFVDDAHGVVWPALLTPTPTGMINVYDLLWGRLCDAGIGRLAAVGWRLNDLPPIDQRLVALWRLEADIHNGGFMQFLCNWGDETCQLALHALELLGAVETRRIVGRMRGMLDHLEDDPRIEQLTDLYGAMTEAEHREMGELDRAFWQQPDDIPRLGVRHFGL